MHKSHEGQARSPRPRRPRAITRGFLLAALVAAPRAEATTRPIRSAPADDAGGTSGGTERDAPPTEPSNIVRSPLDRLLHAGAGARWRRFGEEGVLDGQAGDEDGELDEAGADDDAPEPLREEGDEP